MGGFSTVTGLETIMNADNASFDGTARGGAMTTNGQLWIGSTVAPHVRKGSITSIDGSVTITNGAGTINVAVTGGSTVLKTLSGDSGTATPSSGNITLNANTNSGKTVLFNGSGSTVSLKVTDALSNTVVGLSSGSANMGQTNTGFGASVLPVLNNSGGNASGNTCVGYASGNKITTGQSSTCIGQQSGNGHTTGTGNTFVGSATGTNYTSSESSNILIGANVSGTVGESNVCRIGTSAGGTGQITSCFIAGIAGVTSVSSAVVAGLATGTGQLVQSTITAGAGIAVTPSAGVITIASTGSPMTWTDKNASFAAASGNGYFVTANATATLPASPAQGDTIAFAVDTAATTVTITANTGQTIRIGTAVSGAAGTAANNARGDSIVLVYRSSSTSWVAVPAPQGTWTVSP